MVLIKAYIEYEGSSPMSSSQSSSAYTNNIADDNINIIKSTSNILSLIVDSMEKTHISLQDLIMMLNIYLTSDNDKERNKATYLLADIFHYTGNINNNINNNNNNNNNNNIIIRSSLSSRSIHLYVVFFCNRLTDFPSIIPSIHALYGIIKYYHHITDPKYYDSIDILRTIFKSIHIPSYAQNVRSKVLLLFHELLSHSSIVSCMNMNGPEILEGIINCIEDEKDPRCLLSALKLIHKAIGCFPTSIIEFLPNTNNHTVSNNNNNYTLNNNIQSSKLISINRLSSIDNNPNSYPNSYPNIINKNHRISVLPTITVKIFNATSCYFPITFSPPPNDPFGVTSDCLIAALEDCLCAHKALLLYTIPFVIDQLHSDSSIGRIHALKILNRIVKTEGSTHTAITQVLTTVHPSNPIRDDPALQQLYDMVDDDDDGYDAIAETSGLYIVDSSTTTSPPDQVIERNDKYLKKLSGLLIDICYVEAHHDIVHNALQLIGSITWSICKDLNSNSSSSSYSSSSSSSSYSSSSRSSERVDHDVALSDWRCFNEPIIIRIKEELRNNLSSMKSKSALNIAIIMCKVGGYLASSSVLRELLPLVIDTCCDSSKQMKDIIIRNLKDSSIGVKRLLPIDSNLLSLNASVDVLIQLISCINDPGTITTGTIDYSQLHIFDPLKPHRLRLISILSSFIETSCDESIDLILKDTSTIINPFEAVKAAFNNSAQDITTTCTTTTSSCDVIVTKSNTDVVITTECKVETARVAAIQLPDTVIEAISSSITAMTEVLIR